MAKIWVWAEVDDDLLHDGSLACVGAARSLAGEDGQVECILAGSGVSRHAAALFAAGASTVRVAEDEALAVYLAPRFLDVLLPAVREGAPDLVLLASSTAGNDLAPSAAAALGGACVLDCDALSEEAGVFRFSRAGFDRTVTTHFAPVGDGPVFATLRDGAFEPPPPDSARTGTAEPLAVNLSPDALLQKVIRRDVAKKTVNLRDAKIVVAAGAGVGSAEGLARVQDLARALGAEVGATRAVVDAGWLPADHQIGQTGATIRPEVYVACGISGAVQHRVGMLDSKKIVAINIDPQAPIFRVAHYKLVGDLKVIVPKLTNALSA